MPLPAVVCDWEDTVPGAQAAIAAEMRVIGVACGARTPEELGEADVTVTRLDGEQLWGIMQSVEERD
ncbi:MAG: hypothetical protein QNJ77_13085 [Acidimicrobiia bacterium]|nr:hypothetical protein [Acidimicrobiia bacterium]